MRVNWFGYLDRWSLTRVGHFRSSTMTNIYPNCVLQDIIVLYIIFIIRHTTRVTRALLLKKLTLQATLVVDSPVSCRTMLKIKYFCYHSRILKIRDLQFVMNSFTKSSVRTIFFFKCLGLESDWDSLRFWKYPDTCGQDLINKCSQLVLSCFLQW